MLLHYLHRACWEKPHKLPQTMSPESASESAEHYNIWTSVACFTSLLETTNLIWHQLLLVQHTQIKLRSAAPLFPKSSPQWMCPHVSLAINFSPDALLDKTLPFIWACDPLRLICVSSLNRQSFCVQHMWLWLNIIVFSVTTAIIWRKK